MVKISSRKTVSFDFSAQVFHNYTMFEARSIYEYMNDTVVGDSFPTHECVRAAVFVAMQIYRRDNGDYIY